jgi:hypothetical protein
MAVRRVPLRKTESMTLARVERLTFLSPLLLDGEDADMYEEIVARMCAALKPVDIIDELL